MAENRGMVQSLNSTSPECDHVTSILITKGIPLFIFIILIILVICISCYFCGCPKKKRQYRRQYDIEEWIQEENESPDIYKAELERRKALYNANWMTVDIYPDWRKEHFQALKVTLDPDTAHPALILSEDRLCVTVVKEPQDVSDSEKRFDSMKCVLGLENITSGRYYWEIKVGNRPDWDLGVCNDDVRRKGNLIVSPENGFWGIRLYNDEHWALTNPPTSLSLRQKPRRVCVFLDYDTGKVSFYNMTDLSHIYTFTCVPFYGDLHPFIRLWSFDSESLIISTIP